MTVRRLALIRHSKAEAHGAADHRRVLAPRGRVDATAIGEWLTGQGFSPDCVITSDALRARETWSFATSALGVTPEPILDSRIYDNTVDDLLSVIGTAPEATTSLAVVGHNPSMHALAHALDDGHGDAASRRWLAADFPTSAVAVFEISGP